MDLFEHADEARARDTDPDTSHEAAESLSPRLRQLQEDVLMYAAGESPFGFTHIDLNNHFRTTSSTYRTRCSELVDKGYVADSGDRKAYGPDGKGRRHVIWQVTGPGYEEAQRLHRARGNLNAG
jgi:hypothetical protein